MKYVFSLLLLVILVSCSEPSQTESSPPPPPEKVKNEVLVLGTVHGAHLTEALYGLPVLEDLIRRIEPDLILTEIPPDRFPTAMAEFKETDSITEPRVSRFPEYVDVIFPLSKEMDFEIIPTAGWTQEMADDRKEKLKAISQNPERYKDWARYTAAGYSSDSLVMASGLRYDPYWINSPEYDEIAEVGLSVYNELFNDELGPGGWDNINQAHYDLIAAALDQHQYEGKRVLITYGAGHKGWFLRELAKRDDIELKTLLEIAPPIYSAPH